MFIVNATINKQYADKDKIRPIYIQLGYKFKKYAFLTHELEIE